MKTNNTDLISILLWSWIAPNLLVDSLFVIWRLIKKHGKMLYTDKYITEISVIAQNIWTIITVLKYTGKTSYEDIKKLIKMTKSISKGYKPEFTINSDSQNHNDKLKTYISTKFKNSKINTAVLDNIWIKISGEWRYYKRDLNSDLEKLLS